LVVSAMSATWILLRSRSPTGSSVKATGTPKGLEESHSAGSSRRVARRANLRPTTAPNTALKLHRTCVSLPMSALGTGDRNRVIDLKFARFVRVLPALMRSLSRTLPGAPRGRQARGSGPQGNRPFSPVRYSELRSAPPDGRRPGFLGWDWAQDSTASCDHTRPIARSASGAGKST
jgi:hypothetical protein